LVQGKQRETYCSQKLQPTTPELDQAHKRSKEKLRQIVATHNTILVQAHQASKEKQIATKIATHNTPICLKPTR
jgi:hypothetical protein